MFWMGRRGQLCNPEPEGVPSKVFFLRGNWTVVITVWKRSHVFQLQRVGSHCSIMPKIKTVKRLRAMRACGLRGPEVQ